jgi:hypothetical protein
MALEAAFHDLAVQFEKLRDVLCGLRLTVVEDKPSEGDAMLVEDFGDTVMDLLEGVDGASAAANEGRKAAGHPLDVERARRALAACHERFNRTMYHFSSDLMRYERVSELERLGRERGGEWPVWTFSVKESLDHCQQPFYDVNQALFQCWQEIAERVGMGSVSVQTTSIGQQITVPDGREAAPVGIH